MMADGEDLFNKFTRLYQESRQLNSRIRAGSHDNFFLPQLQRGLEQLDELTANLTSKLSSITTDNEASAALFLASRGFDITQLNSRLSKLSSISALSGVTHATVEAGKGGFIDLDSFLSNDLEEAITDIIETELKSTKTFIKSVIKERREAVWRQQYNEFVDSVTLNASLHISTNNAAASQKETIKSPKVSAYASCVLEFNESRLRGNTPILAQQFAKKVINIDGDHKGAMINDCWKALNFILHPSTSHFEEMDNVFEVKDISKPYLDDEKGWRDQLIKGSLRFLEDGYLRFVEKTLAQYPRDALLGGRPSSLERIRAFCDIKLKRTPPIELNSIETIGGSPVWMILFTLCRCGLFEDALKLINSLEMSLQRVDPNFIAYFKAFASSSSASVNPRNQQLTSSTLLNQLREDFNQLLSKGNYDPYKFTLLKLMGKCDLNRKSVSSVINTSEDYIWLQLWLIQENTTEDYSLYTLENVQKIVTDFGSKHFDPRQNNPWLYAEILILVGSFEKALEHLHQNGQAVDAIHFMISMAQAGTLRISHSISDNLFTSSTTKSHSSVNYGNLLCSYAKNLGKLDVMEGINYLLLLPLLKGPQYETLCHSNVRDLILKSGDFGTLLGDIRADGSIIPGALSQYSRLMRLPDTKAFMETITSSAAAKCDREGRFREALQLFNLSSKYEKVMEVISVKLSKVFSGPFVAMEVDELLRTTESILKYYLSQPHISSTLTTLQRKNCTTLMSFLRMRAFYEEANWTAALECITEQDIIPLEGSGAGGEVGMIAVAADQIKNLPDTITTLLPDLLLLIMNCIVRQVRELKPYIGVDGGRAQQVELLRRMACNLMTFTGMLKMRIPPEVHSQLSRLQIQII